MDIGGRVGGDIVDDSPAPAHETHLGIGLLAAAGCVEHAVDELVEYVGGNGLAREARCLRQAVLGHEGHGKPIDLRTPVVELAHHVVVRVSRIEDGREHLARLGSTALVAAVDGERGVAGREAAHGGVVATDRAHIGHTGEAGELRRRLEHESVEGRPCGDHVVTAHEAEAEDRDCGLRDAHEPEGEPGVDSEVASGSPAQGPEEIGILRLARCDELAIGEDDLGGLEVIAGHARPPRVVADAAAEHEPGDADSRAGSDGQHPLAAPEVLQEIEVERTRAEGYGATLAVDLD